MSETNVVSKSQRELSRVKVVYQYNDVLLWQEPASILNKSLMIAICERLFLAINEKPISINIKPLWITNTFLPNQMILLPGVDTNQMKIILSSQGMLPELYWVIQRHARV